VPVALPPADSPRRVGGVRRGCGFLGAGPGGRIGLTGGGGGCSPRSDRRRESERTSHLPGLTRGVDGELQKWR